MTLKNIFSFFTLATLISCAGSNISSDIDKDIAESFEISQRKLQKFKVRKKTPLKNQEVTSTEKSKKTKKGTIRKTEKKVIPKKKIGKQKEIQELEEKKEALILRQKPETKSDYPKSFQKYNKKYAIYWNKFRPVLFPGERFEYEISWSIFKAGTATIETLNGLQLGDKDVFSIKATMESAKYFENIYKLKNSLNTYIGKENFFPLKYELKQRESSQSVDDLQLFDEEELRTTFFYKREKEGKTKIKNEEKYLPRYFTDSFSALYFVRGLPLKVGYNFGFPMVTRTKVWLLKAEVVSRETINIMDKDIDAFKVKAVTQFPGVLKKRGDIVFWYSADKQRKLLKFEAKVKIGTVKGILKGYKPGQTLD